MPCCEVFKYYGLIHIHMFCPSCCCCGNCFCGVGRLRSLFANIVAANTMRPMMTPMKILFARELYFFFLRSISLCSFSLASSSAIYEPGDLSMPSGIFNNAFLYFTNLHKHLFLYSAFIASQYNLASFVILFTHNVVLTRLGLNASETPVGVQHMVMRHLRAVYPFSFSARSGHQWENRLLLRSRHLFLSLAPRPSLS